MLRDATDVAHAAGRLLIERAGHAPAGIRTKSTHTDPVSDADRAAEELITTLISERRPGDGIVAEEGAREPSSSGLTWIVDPLDGTVNFLYGIPTWCVSIAVAAEGDVSIGVVHDPNGPETFWATRGGGAYLNGRRVAVSQVEDPSVSLIGTGFSYAAAARAVQAERLTRVLPAVRDIRRAGSAALDLCSLACGRLDGFFEAPMKPWDKAAGILIVAEAGGIVGELPAPPPSADHGVIAAGPKLYERLSALVLG